jgi:hypothetical protein
LTRLAERLAGDARVSAEVSRSIEQVRIGDVLTTAEVLKSHILSLTADMLADGTRVAVQVKQSLEQVRQGDVLSTANVLSGHAPAQRALHKNADIEARPLPFHDAYEREG